MRHSRVSLRAVSCLTVVLLALLRDDLCATGGVLRIWDPDDSRLVLYRRKDRRDHRSYQVQVRDLAIRALGAAQGGTSADDQCKVRLSRLGCAVDVHYHWDCLRHLRNAQKDGRQPATVDSALLSITAPLELSELAIEVAGPDRVFSVGPDLLDELCMDLGWGDPVRYAIAWPVPRKLQAMRPPFLVLEDLVSSQNLGQVIRSALLLGVSSFVLSRSTWNCLNGRACHASQGWMYHADFHLAEPLKNSLAELKDLGVHLYAAEETFQIPVAPHGSSHWALLVGNEERGVSEEILALCDARVCVLQTRGASLNVAHAAAICLHELGRGMDT